MNFAESMAISSGLKKSKPHIEESFFPVVPKKYITISSENHQSKQWDHFQEFINLIKPMLDKEGISIIEIGSNEVQLQNVISLKGATNANHWAYIIKNSILHIGPENFLSHLSSFYDTPCVMLFSNTSPDYALPSWSKNKDNQYILQSDLKSNKPSFSSEEPIKSINTISAEKCASITLDHLSIDNSFSDIEVFYIGPLHHHKLVEIVPDFIPQPNFFPKSLINLRLDYHFNEESLLHFASNRKISIVSDKQIDTRILSRIKPAISHLFLKINESFDLNYVKFLKHNGFNISLIATEDANLSDTRLKFFDFDVSEETKKTKKDLDISELICDDTRYQSSKQIFSKDGIFSSKSSFDRKIKNHKDQIVIDEKSFWEDAEYFKFYNLKS